MTQAEFIELHGQAAWEQLVSPSLHSDNIVERSNANIIWHERIGRILSLLDFGTNSLLKAKEDIIFWDEPINPLRTSIGDEMKK